MSKIFRLSILMALIAVAMIGCGNDDKENQPAIKPQNQEVLTQTVFADQTDGKSGVTFVTAGPWTSTIKEGALKAGTEPWVSIDPASGDKAGTYTININLEPNTTGEDRSAVITIACNGEEIKITVTQKGTKEDGKIPVSGVMLNQTTATLTVGDKLTLAQTVTPGNATDKTVSWTSSNTAVATVVNGVVTAVSQGTATITATTQDGNKTATCSVTVSGSMQMTMTLNKSGDFSLDLRGIGTVTISWGDMSQIETYPLSLTTATECKHKYSTTSLRTITITGDNITELDCNVEQLRSLDVSKNIMLTYLSCYLNKLTELDVSKNIALKALYCSGNQLSKLDLNKNIQLYILSCGDNQLSSLDLSMNNKLNYLWCAGNKLTALDMSNIGIREVKCQSNQMSAAALNALFNSLASNNNNWGQTIYIYNNPGTTTCDTGLATSKGWPVDAVSNN